MTTPFASTAGEVWHLVSGSNAQLLYAAGTPEAAAWFAENSEPHDLDPATPLPDDVPDGDIGATEPPVEDDGTTPVEPEEE